MVQRRPVNKIVFRYKNVSRLRNHFYGTFLQWEWQELEEDFWVVAYDGPVKIFCVTFVAYFYSSWVLQQQTPSVDLPSKIKEILDFKVTQWSPLPDAQLAHWSLWNPRKAQAGLFFLSLFHPTLCRLGGVPENSKKLGALSDYSYPDTLVQWRVLWLAYLLLGSLLCQFVCCFAMPPPAPPPLNFFSLSVTISASLTGLHNNAGGISSVSVKFLGPFSVRYYVVITI